MKQKHTKACPRCGRGQVYKGEHKAYNSVAKDGTHVCADCKAEETIQDLLRND